MTTESAHLDIAELAKARWLAASGEGRRIRLKAHITLRELGGSVGVTAHTVYRWETGELIPRGKHALAYLAALRVIGR